MNHRFCQCYLLTAPSRFWKYAEEKMIQILSSRYGVSQALSHVRVHLIKESKLRAVEVLENLILYCVYIFRTLQNFGRLYFWTVFGRNWNRAIFFASDAIIPGQTEFWFGKLVIILIKSYQQTMSLNVVKLDIIYKSEASILRQNLVVV